MSTTIDNRIVEMQFDNRQFETNAQTSLGTLAKLQQSLNFKGASKGMENVNAAAKGCNFSPLHTAIEGVSLKFNAMYSIADTAFRRITNSAITAGKRIMGSVTVDPVKMGFSEYETQIGAIQTILANTQSKGENIDTVNAALDELNAYADQTIYNFTEMTRNIGTFTAAGVGLKESTNAIKGIANLAAVSGSTSQQASTAMYQLSQALAAGKVSLMDWNSVVNAGMGGEIFQEALKRTSRNLGTGVDEAIKKYGTFRESLTQGDWLTKEVLTETLAQLSGAYTEADLITQGYTEAQAKEIMELARTAQGAATDVKTFTQLMDTSKEALQSGWTQTWEYVIGDFEEAKALWSNISKTIGGFIEKTSAKRNKVVGGAMTSNLDKFKDGLTEAGVSMDDYTKKVVEVAKQHGMTDKDIEILMRDYGSLEGAIKAGAFSNDVLRESLKALVPTTSVLTGELHGLITDGLDKLGGRELLIKSFSNVFKGLGNIIKPISQTFKHIFPPLTAERLYELIEGFNKLTTSFKNWTASYKGKASIKKLTNTFKGLFAAIDIGWQFIKDLTTGIVDLTKSVLPGLGGGLLGATGSIGEWLVKLRDSVKETNLFGKVVSAITGFIKRMIASVKNVFSFIGSKIKMPGWEGFFGLLKSVWGFVSKVGSKIAEVSKIIGSGLADAFRNGDFSSMLDLFNGGLIAGILLSVKKFFGGLNDIVGSGRGFFDSIKENLDAVKGCLEAWQQSLQATTLLKIAGAIGILAVSLMLIAAIDPGRLTGALTAITVLFADLIGSMALFSKIDTSGMKGVTKAVGLMIGVSIAVLILASALKKIADLSWEELGKGLVGIVGLMAIIVLATKALSSGGKKAIKGAAQMVIFALAVKILASVCKDLSSLSWEELGKGLAGVAGLLLAVVGFTKLIGKPKGMMSAGIGMIAIGAAMKIFASVMKDFSKMSWEEIGKGLAAMAGALLSVALAMKLVPKNALSVGTGVIVVASAMLILANVMGKMSGMSWEEIGKGLAAMAGALLTIAMAMKLMPKNTFGIALGLAVVASAMLILENVMSKMSGMSWEEIGRGLALLGGSIAILSIGLALMKKSMAGAAALAVAALSLAVLTPVLKALGGMDVGSIVKSLAAIAAVFTIVGVAGKLIAPVVPTIMKLAAAMALVGVAMLAFGVGLLAAGAGLTALAVGGSAAAAAIVSFFTQLGYGIVEFIKIIGSCATEIGVAVKAIVVMVLDVLKALIPTLVDGLLKLIVELLGALATYAPQVVDGLVNFLVNVLNSLAARMPELVSAVMNVIVALFTAITDAIGSFDAATLKKAGIGVALLSAMVLLFSTLAAFIPGALVGLLGIGLFIAELALVLAAIGALAKIEGLQWLIDQGGSIMQSIGTAIGKFVGGLAGGIAEGLSGSLPTIGSDLSSFMTNIGPFIEGAKGITEEAVSGVGRLVAIIAAITGAALLEGIASFITGTSSVDTFSTQLASLATALTTFSTNTASLSDDDITKVETVAGVIDALLTASGKIPKSGGLLQAITGTPDLVSFASGLTDLGTAIATFSTTVSTISEAELAKMTSVATAAESLTTLASKIPKKGGLVQAITGTPDLVSFAIGITSLGAAIVAFCTTVAEVTDADLTKMTSVATAAESLTTLASKIPKKGGLVQAITGTGDLIDFAIGIMGLGTAIANFTTTVSEVTDSDLTKISSVATAAGSIVDLAAKIPKQDGLLQAIIGAPSLTEFAGEMQTFGLKVAEFAGAVTEVTEADISKMNSIGTAASTLVGVATSLSAYNGSKIFNTNLTEFAGEMKNFGDKMAEYAESIKDITLTKSSSVVSQANRFVKLATSLEGVDTAKLKSFGKDMAELGKKVKDFHGHIADVDTGKFGTVATSLDTLAKIKGDSSGLQTFVNSLGDVSVDGVNSFVNSFKNSAPKVVSAVTSMLTKAEEAIRKKAATIKNAVKTLVLGAADASKNSNAVAGFESAGKSMVQGFAAGISANTFRATARAKAMAEAALAAAKAVLKINSPSKVFMGVGESVPEGFAKGIDNLGYLVTDSAKSMAHGALNGTKKAISNLSSIVAEGIDAQPTIRPVLDLSEVSAGASAIDGMFGMQPSVGVMSNVGVISSMMNNRQNGVNNDVISAIKELGSKLGNTSGDTYNVNGVTYDDGSNVTNAVKALIRGVKVERRI